MAELTLEGLEDLLEDVQQLGAKASRVENKALRAGAKVIQEGMSKRASRSRLNKPHLADNIEISGVKRRAGTKYIEVGPGKKFFYGIFLELGTSKMDKRPFMQPTMVADGDKSTQAMAAELKKGLA